MGGMGGSMRRSPSTGHLQLLPTTLGTSARGGATPVSGAAAAACGFTGLDTWPDDRTAAVADTGTGGTTPHNLSIGRSSSLGEFARSRLWARGTADPNAPATTTNNQQQAHVSHQRTIGKLISNEMFSAVREAMIAGSPPDDGASPSTGNDTPAANVDRILLHKLHLAHFAACLGTEDVGFYESAFALCDLDGDGKCTLDNFVTFFELVFDELVALKAALNGSESSVSALAFLANAIALVILVISAFIIFDVSLTAVVVPLSTFFLSLSFAVGPSVANVVGSLIFVFERRFDVGDRVTAKGVGPEEGTILTVQQINVLTTSFLTFTNRLVIVPNWVLAASVIENLKRSPTANVCLALAVSTNTTSRQLEALQMRLRTFTEAESSSFKPGVWFRIRGIERGNILLSVWACSHFTYGQAPDCYRGIFSLWLATLEGLKAEGIACRLADQTIMVRGEAGTTGTGLGGMGGEGMAEFSKLVAATGGKVAA